MFGLEPKADVDAELAFHVEMRVRELVDQGETPERARQLAIERFGDVEGLRRQCVAIDERRKKHIQRSEYSRGVEAGHRATHCARCGERRHLRSRRS